MAGAIRLIRSSAPAFPSLEALAAETGMSTAHFQKTFTAWAGISPKQFAQVISISNAKRLIQARRPSLFDVSDDTGLSSVSRLHDLFVRIERMSPGTYKNGAQGLNILYDFLDTRFGVMIAAETPIGLCYLMFADDREQALEAMMNEYPKAEFIRKNTQTMLQVTCLINDRTNPDNQLVLHLKGTDFQIQVWNALLQIPEGRLETYSAIAGRIGHQKASRAVGTAVGANQLAYLIPCHRVIREEGEMGGYRWGLERKAALLGSELNAI